MFSRPPTMSGETSSVSSVSKLRQVSALGTGMGWPAAMVPMIGTGAPSARLQELDGARDLAVTPDVALLLQDAQVVVHHRGGADVAGLLDLADARRVVVLVDEPLDEPEDPPLLRRELLHS